jgi:glycerophosphoryl diester phosphodiesterase
MPSGRVIGHRGAPRLAPENTLESFRAAAHTGVAWVETDVSLLGDGTPVICHDPDLVRIADRPERLRDLCRADLERLGVALRVPTLDAALAALASHGLSVNLDIKTHGGEAGAVAEATLAALDACAWPLEKLVISSFNFAVLERLRALRPDLPLGLLYDAPADDWCATARRLGAATIHPNHAHLSAAITAEMIAAGVRVLTWTVNRPADAIRLWRWGVDGVITDDPALMLGLDDSET